MKHAALSAKRPALIGSVFAVVVAVRALDAAYWVPPARYSDVAQPVDVMKTDVLAKVGVGRL